MSQPTGYADVRSIGAMCRQLRGEIAQLAACAAEVSLRDSQARRRAFVANVHGVSEFDRLASVIAQPALDRLRAIEGALGVAPVDSERGGLGDSAQSLPENNRLS